MHSVDPQPEREPQPAPLARSWRRRHPLAFGIVVGLAGATLVTAASLFVLAALARTPRLSRADYEAAVKRWDAKGPASYDLDLELGGNRPGKIHVEVRNGDATTMIRDGVVPKQRRTWDYWTVPGQLDTIGQELDMAEHPAVSFGAPKAAEVVIWAEFDPTYGYPIRYDRVFMGADVEVHWKTTKFRVVKDDSAAAAGKKEAAE